MSALLNAAGAIIDTDVDINDRFEFKIQTPADNSTFILGIQINNAVTIYWGDGTVEENISADYPSHTYATAGIYSISVQRYGQGSHCITSLRFSHDASSAQMVLSVDNLGTDWRALNFSTYKFCRDCSNMLSFSSGNTNAGFDGYESFQNCSSCTYFDVSTMTGGTSQYGRTFLGCSSAEFVNVGGLHGQTATPSRFLQNNLPAGCEVIGVENFGPPVLFSSYADFLNTQEQYEKLLINWAPLVSASGVSVSFGSVQYAANGSAAAAKQSIVDTYSWVITDGGELNAPFQFTIQTTTANESFTIPCQNVGTFDATIDWGDSTTSTITAYNDADLTHTYATAGTYQISISGKFPSISFNNSASAAKVISVDNLGTVGWQSFQNAFYGCSNMTSFTAGTCSTSEVTNMFYMFASCSSLTTLDLTAFDTENLTNMFGTFSSCTSLVNLNISTWDTSNVTTFYRAFFNCSNLATLTAPNLSVSSATTLNWMFSACSSLTQLDVSNWDTSNVSDFNGIVRNCSSLTELNVSGWDTSSATKFEGTFYNLSSVTSLDVSRFDVSGADDFDYMFYGCSSLTSLDVSNFDTSSATSMSFMFMNCSSLTSLDVSNFDTSTVTNMGYMFLGCSSLTSLDLSNFNTSSVTRMDNMFGFCYALVSVNISSFDTSSVTNIGSMFQKCYALESLDVSHFDTSSVTNMNGIFYFCSSLTDIIGVENFNFENLLETSVNFLLDTSSVKRLRIDRLLRTFTNQNIPQNITLYLGSNKYSANGSAETARQTLVDTYGWTIIDGGPLESPLQVTIQTATNNETVTLPITGVTSVDIDWGDSNTDTNVTTDNPTHTYATAGTYQISATGKASAICYYNLDATEKARLISVDNLGTMGVNNLFGAFSSCPNLTSITSGVCDVYSVQGYYAYYLFANSSGVVTVDMTGMDTSAATSFERPFISCPNIQTVDTRGGFFSFESCVNLNGFFQNCSTLQYVYGLEDWDVSNVVDLDIFPGCSSLLEADVSKWNTSSATSFVTFNGCSSLTELDVSNWDTSSATSMFGMFSNCTGLSVLDVANFDTSNVTSINGIFYNSNVSVLDVSNWNTSKVTDTRDAFRGINLNSLDISNWDMSSIEQIGFIYGNGMFRDATITDLKISAENWNVSNLTIGQNFAGGFGPGNIFSTRKYNRVLINWAAQSLQSNVNIHFDASKYSANGAAADARQSMVDTYGWIIIDGGAEDAPFQFTIQTATTNESFTIPCQNVGTFDATINWGDGSATQTITAYNDANLTHTFATAGTYQIEISGKFPNIRFFTDATSAAKVISVNNLGTMGWQRFDNAFRGCSNMTSFTPGTTSTLDVTDMSYMFSGCSSLTTLDLTAFDTSNVTSIQGMFQQSTSLVSLDITSFDTSNVTSMGDMFYLCSSLPSLDVTNFNTSNVTTMNGMFGVCDSLVGEGVLDVSGFDTSNVTNMPEMFRRTQVTNLDLRKFKTSKLTSFRAALERYNYPDEDVLGIETFDVSNITNFNTSGSFSTERYDAMLINYSSQNLQTGVEFKVGTSKYTPGGDAEAARTILVNTYGWVITDGGPVT